MFLLNGLRDREVLSAVQTTPETVERDIETFNTQLGLPFNTKLVGIYIQYSDFDETLHDLVKSVRDAALSKKLVPLSGLLVAFKDNSNTQDYVTTSYYLQGETRKHVRLDIEHADLKREYVLNNFFYLGVRLRFEGFDDELHRSIEGYLQALSGKSQCFIHMKGLLGTPVSQKQLLIEEMGKKLNIEAKKLIKANKVSGNAKLIRSLGKATVL